MKSPVLNALKAKLSGKKKEPTDLADVVRQEPSVKSRPMDRVSRYVPPLSPEGKPQTIIPGGDYEGTVTGKPLVRVDRSGNMRLVGKLIIEYKLGQYANWDIELTPQEGEKTSFTSEEIKAMQRQQMTGRRDYDYK